MSKVSPSKSRATRSPKRTSKAYYILHILNTKFLSKTHQIRKKKEHHYFQTVHAQYLQVKKKAVRVLFVHVLLSEPSVTRTKVTDFSVELAFKCFLYAKLIGQRQT